MARPSRRFLVASCTMLFALTGGCGARKPCPGAEGAFACVDGATLAAPSSCEFPLTSVSGLESRTAKALEIAGVVWGVEPTDYLTGWVISFCGGWFVCGGGDSATWTYGCTRTDTEVITAAAGPSHCLSGVLIHEFGHVVVGDRAHRDPRFAVADDLAAIPCK
jgi:hypothetical protein